MRSLCSGLVGLVALAMSAEAQQQSGTARLTIKEWINAI